MIVVLLAIYTFFLAFIWGFFIIAKIHAYKFKNFSSNIEYVSKILFIILAILSICGYIIIFSFNSFSSQSSIDISTSDYTDTYY